MVKTHGSFVWYELMTTDVEAARAFYAKVVGGSTSGPATPGSAYSLLTIADAPVAGMVDLPDQALDMGVPPHWMGYVAVDDVDAAVARVKQLGGTVRVQPMDIPNISRFAIVADPQMATFALVKGLKPTQAPLAVSTELGRIGWHELLAANWQAAFAFYRVLFGWEEADSHTGAMGTYQRFSSRGETIGGMFSKPATLPMPFWLYYFNIGDMEAALVRVEANGGRIIYGPVAVPTGGRIVHCTDPQGAVFGLLDRRLPSGYSIGSQSLAART